MLQRIWQHLRQPAMVVALVALMSSLTGAATAALITGKQIRNNSITSADIRNGSLVRTDFKLSERRRLKGPTGPAGAQGPQGPPGPTAGPAGGDLAGSYPNPALSVRPSARVQATEPQTAPPSTLTPIRFAQAPWDTAGMFNPAQPDRLTIPRSGLWQVEGVVTYGSGSGLREVFVRVNGEAQHLVDARTGNTSNAGHPVSGTLKLAAGDVLQLVFFHQSAGSIDTAPLASGAAGFPFLAATYLGPAG